MLGHRTVLPHSAKTPGWGEKPALGVWDAGASRTAGAQEWEERAPGALLSPRSASRRHIFGVAQLLTAAVRVNKGPVGCARPCRPPSPGTKGAA